MPILGRLALVGIVPSGRMSAQRMAVGAVQLMGIGDGLSVLQAKCVVRSAGCWLAAGRRKVVAAKMVDGKDGWIRMFQLAMWLADDR